MSTIKNIIAGVQFESNHDTACKTGTPYKITDEHELCTDTDYPHIATIEDCQNAAEVLGFKWDGQEGNGDGKAPFCNIKSDTKKVKWNPDSDAVDRGYEMDYRRNICRIPAATTQAPAVTTQATAEKKHELQPVNTRCGSDNENVGSQSDCEAAATELGLAYGKSENMAKGWPKCHLNVPNNQVWWNRKSNPSPSSTTADNNKSICKIIGKL